MAIVVPAFAHGEDTQQPIVRALRGADFLSITKRGGASNSSTHAYSRRAGSQDATKQLSPVTSLVGGFSLWRPARAGRGGSAALFVMAARNLARGYGIRLGILGAAAMQAKLDGKSF
jgi:hypothetical protein